MVSLKTVFLVLAGLRGDTPAGTFLGILSCVLLIGAAAELLKHFVNRGRVEVLKELKSLEIQLLEIKEQLRERKALI